MQVLEARYSTCDHEMHPSLKPFLESKKIDLSSYKNNRLAVFPAYQTELKRDLLVLNMQMFGISQHSNSCSKMSQK